MMSPATRRCSDGARLRLRACSQQQIVEHEAAIDLFAAQGLGHFQLAHAGLALLERRQHRRDHALGWTRANIRSLPPSCSRAAVPAGTPRRRCRSSTISCRRIASPSAGMNAELDADPTHAGELLDVRQHVLHRLLAAEHRQVEIGRPEFSEIALVGLHAAADIGSLLGLALAIDQRRQVAADADRIHRVEEEEAVSAEQILDVVF